MTGNESLIAQLFDTVALIFIGGIASSAVVYLVYKLIESFISKSSTVGLLYL